MAVEADAHFGHIDSLLKEKRIIDKAHGQGRQRQVSVEYITRKGELL